MDGDARRRELAAKLLQQANALYDSMQVAQEAAAEDSFDGIEVTLPPPSRPKSSSKVKVKAKPAPKTPTQAMSTAEEEVRQLRKRAALAKERLTYHARNAAAPFKEKPLPPAAAPAAAPVAANAASRAESQRQIQKLKVEMRMQQREMEALRERELALAGVLASLKLEREP